MSRPKGGKNKYWSTDEKLEFIRRMLNGESSIDISKEGAISSGLLRNWMMKYKNGGEAALVNKRKPGNPLAKYQNKKNLTEIEKLEYENMKLRIENLRLKKGYTNEEAVKSKLKK